MKKKLLQWKRIKDKRTEGFSYTADSQMGKHLITEFADGGANYYFYSDVPLFNSFNMVGSIAPSKPKFFVRLQKGFAENHERKMRETINIIRQKFK